MALSLRKTVRYGAAVTAVVSIFLMMRGRRGPSSPELVSGKAESKTVEAKAEEARMAAIAAAAASSAVGTPEAPPEQRGYVRRLVTKEVPPPGADPVAVAAAAAAVRSGSGMAPGGYANGGGAGRGASASVGVFGSGGTPWNPADGRPVFERTGHAPAPAVGSAANLKLDKVGPGMNKAAPDAKWSPETAAVISEAARLKQASAEAMRPWESTPAGAALSQQLAADAKTDAGVRSAISALGPSATPEAKEQAAAQALAANGVEPTPEAVAAAVAGASAPPPAPIPPEVADQTARDMLALQPRPEEIPNIIRDANAPPSRPNSPPGRGFTETYSRYKDVMERASHEFGVKVALMPAIIEQETAYGRNTGNRPLVTTLFALMNDPRQARRARADLAATYRLAARGELGDKPLAEVRCNEAAACGIPQFLPASWEAYGRSAGGGGKNPWNMADAIMSVGNYLKSNGYARSPERAIWAYNHDNTYVRQVQQREVNIDATIKRMGQNP